MTRSIHDVLAEVERSVRDGANKGLYLGAEHVLNISNESVPIEEGTLGRSARVTQDETNLQAAASYDTPYAVPQHEDLAMRHDPGRSAKFLENAMNSQRGTVAQIITTSIRRELGT